MEAESSIAFLSPMRLYEREKPFFSNIPFFEIEGARQSNLRTLHEPVTVHDIRGKENAYTLEQNGFQLVKEEAFGTSKDFEDDSWIMKEYEPKVKEIIKRATGAERVEIFDFTKRKMMPGFEPGSYGTKSASSPIPTAHCDNTLGSCLRRVMRDMGDEATILLKERVQIINLWRPLSGPIKDWPLAVCDYSSIDHRDMIATDMIFPHYDGEVFSMIHNKNQRWFYLSDQNPDELWLLKCAETDQSVGMAKLCAHGSFRMKNLPLEFTPRESIEFRTMVFFPSVPK
ncbi:uncharacterized protein F4807DRAFT_291240 [Annulohypoxylon truncatum]|uniref:uncharacterized protein n=1 Tax=Annulohypoxylon truncatum TaxID=327061 RepID=UPI00200787C2|nr:uncharacterized protein F4807DRAFT_291240 [Annulohypoxylon truncatum]KAI1205233.1 hypothetical protein F4807DRAFT_291240 [Annulohypoxylon truncatum]